MDDTIKDYLIKNKNKYKLELLDLKKDFKDRLKTEDLAFLPVIEKHFNDKVRSHIIKDMSLNLGVDFETSLIEIEEVNMLDYLK